MNSTYAIIIKNDLCSQQAVQNSDGHIWNSFFFWLHPVSTFIGLEKAHSSVGGLLLWDYVTARVRTSVCSRSPFLSSVRRHNQVSCTWSLVCTGLEQWDTFEVVCIISCFEAKEANKHLPGTYEYRVLDVKHDAEVLLSDLKRPGRYMWVLWCLLGLSLCWDSFVSVWYVSWYVRTVISPF